MGKAKRAAAGCALCTWVHIVVFWPCSNGANVPTLMQASCGHPFNVTARSHQERGAGVDPVPELAAMHTTETPPTSMNVAFPSIEDATDQFWRDGFLVIDDAFEAQLMDHLDKFIVAHQWDGIPPGSEYPPGARTDAEAWVLMNWSDPLDRRCRVECPSTPVDFDELDLQPFLKELTSAILGPGWIRRKKVVMYSANGTMGQAWHQDSPPQVPHEFTINRLVFTRDTRPEVGGQIMVVPGTHMPNPDPQVLPYGEPGTALPGQLELWPNKGSFVLIHGHTWHRVLPPHGGHRASINSRALPAGCQDNGGTDTTVYRNLVFTHSTGLRQVRVG